MHPRCRFMIIYHEVKATVGNVGNEIKPNENYRQIIPELPYKPVSEERCNQLIIPLKKMGVTIHRDEDSESVPLLFPFRSVPNGGLAFITSLANTVPTAANIMYYAKIVEE